MKALILSCNTGGGHNAAGKALLERLQKSGVEADFADALGIAGKQVSHRVDRIYVGVTTKAPGVFRAMYRAGSAISNPHFKSPVYAANRIYRKKVCEFIKEGGYDTVFTPHLFPAQTLTSLRRGGRIDVRVIAVATDYTCIPFWEETEPDYFVIPSGELCDEFAKKGIPREKLVPLGIPVADRFTARGPKCDAKLRLSLDRFEKLILIMSGSMGFGHLTPLIRGLLSKTGGETGIAVICGSNEKLLSTLKAQFCNNDRVTLFGYTDQVAEFMDACDVIITKPGGLTTTEAAAKRLPLVHADPIPGCETKNARFFSQRGMSVCSPGDPERLCELTVGLLENKEMQDDMRTAQEQYINPFAARDICEFAENLK